MWGLEKPNIQDAYKDLDDMVYNGDIPLVDKKSLLNLYNEYDNQIGHVTDVQHDAIKKGTASKIRALYSQTTNTYNHKTDTLTYGRYYYLREELMSGVYKCPLCGIAQDLTLDHYMPKTYYPALAMYRLNMVPICGTCNRVKNAQGYDKFVHPYYFIPPKGVFLRANIKVRPNAIYAYLEIDEKSFTDYTEVEHLRTHLHSLNIDMRLQNAIISFLQIEIVNNCTNEKVLMEELPSKIEALKDYGQNHWKLAVLRALYEVYHRGEMPMLIQAIQYIKSASRDMAI